MPPCIRQIVLEVKNGVLDVDGIEAFINHSQNETNVFGFARQFYSDDVGGIRQQLEEISRRYYKKWVDDSDAHKFMESLRRTLDGLKPRPPYIKRHYFNPTRPPFRYQDNRGQRSLIHPPVSK